MRRSTRVFRRAAPAALIATAMLFLASAASAAGPPLELHLTTPAFLQPGQTGPVSTVVFNSEGQPLAPGSSIHLVETVPPGLRLTPPGGFRTSAGPIESECQALASGIECTLTFPSGLGPGVGVESLPAGRVEAEAVASGDLSLQVELSATGVPAPVHEDRQIAIGALAAGIAAWNGALEGPETEAFTQAAATPYRFVTDLRPVTTPQPIGPRSEIFAEVLAPLEQAKTVIVHLPPGFVGNPQAAPRCTLVQLTQSACPQASQVGLFRGNLVTGEESATVNHPVFNMVPPVGAAAEMAFSVEGIIAPIVATLRPSDYGIDVSSANINTTLIINDVTVDIWGSPQDPAHDHQRAECAGLWQTYHGGVSHGGSGGSCPSQELGRTRPFLRAPTTCGQPLTVGVDETTYQHPGQPHHAEFQTPAQGSCERVPFHPSLSAQTTSREAESTSGLDAHLTMPNLGLENPEAISESDMKKARVALPRGVTLNPSQAEGLGVCTRAEYESTELSFYPTGKGCPSDSRIGSVEVHTPLLANTIPGNVYVAKPYDNPFDSLLAIYVVLEEPERGILVRLPGKVETDETTGQIVTTFDNLPQTPFSSFDFKFREGARAPLVTPPTCGTYTTEAQFTPWSDPGRTVESDSSFQVTQGIGGGPCPPNGTPGFNPGFEAGSINNNAGSYSPFYMRLTRSDGEQDMTRFSSVLPPGVLGRLAGLAKCPESAIADAKAKSGIEEREHPSCPADSEIGRTIVGSGVGSVLTYIPGKLYLGGPFNGDPLSVIAITPALAGPFDVGTVVVHEALTLNPKTAEVEVDGSASDPIPHILKGIPAKVRDLRVYVDRPDFTLNPTSCDPSSAKAILFGSGADPFDDLDDVPVDLSARYQAASCASLGFRPHLGLRLRGGTTRGRFPALEAVYTPHEGDANVKDLAVRLPSSAFLEQGHIRTICTRAQYATDACPKAAQYGYVKAWTPLLDEPLEGPVWLRSSNHKLPDMVFDLRGLVNVEVDARIDSFNGGIRATVENAPDAPISRVVLRMQGGKNGLIVNSTNLCAHPGHAVALFDAHNGRIHDTEPAIKTDCRGKAHRHGKGHRRGRAGR